MNKIIAAQERSSDLLLSGCVLNITGNALLEWIDNGGARMGPIKITGQRQFGPFGIDIGFIISATDKSVTYSYNDNASIIDGSAGIIYESSRNQPLGFAGLDASGNIVADVVIRTGTTAELAAIAGADGEIAFATDDEVMFRYKGGANPYEEYASFAKTYKEIAARNIYPAEVLSSTYLFTSTVIVSATERSNSPFFVASRPAVATDKLSYSFDGVKWLPLPLLPSVSTWNVSCAYTAANSEVVAAMLTTATSIMYVATKASWSFAALDFLVVGLYTPLVFREDYGTYLAFPQNSVTTNTYYDAGGGGAYSLPATERWLKPVHWDYTSENGVTTDFFITTNITGAVGYVGILANTGACYTSSLPSALGLNAVIVCNTDYIVVTGAGATYRARIAPSVADARYPSALVWESIGAFLPLGITQLMGCEKYFAGYVTGFVAWSKDGTSWDTMSTQPSTNILASPTLIGMYYDKLVFTSSNKPAGVLNLETRVISPISAFSKSLSALSTTTDKVLNGYLLSMNASLKTLTNLAGNQPKISELIASATTSSVSVANDVTTQIINPATAIASLTVTLPTYPYDGQLLTLLFGGTITTGNVATAMTLTGGTLIGTVPTSATAGTVIRLRYVLATRLWYVA